MQKRIVANFLDKNGTYSELIVAAQKIICPRCDGNGTHVNPSIDLELTLDDLSDPDFSEAYRRGDYDVNCEQCNGEKIVLVPDENSLTEEQRADHWRYLDEVAQNRREDEAVTLSEFMGFCDSVSAYFQQMHYSYSNNFATKSDVDFALELVDFSSKLKKQMPYFVRAKLLK